MLAPAFLPKSRETLLLMKWCRPPWSLVGPKVAAAQAFGFHSGSLFGSRAACPSERAVQSMLAIMLLMRMLIRPREPWPHFSLPFLGSTRSRPAKAQRSDRFFPATVPDAGCLLRKTPMIKHSEEFTPSGDSDSLVVRHLVPSSSQSGTRPIQYLGINLHLPHFHHSIHPRCLLSSLPSPLLQNQEGTSKEVRSW